MNSTFTAALARLLTDRDLRLRFRTEPEHVCNSLGLNDTDAQQLIAVPSEQLDAQATGLIRKRYHEVTRLLPETMSRLGSRRFELFAEFAEQFWPQGQRRHEIDALQFCRHLARTGRCPAAMLEANALRFALGRRKFAVHLVRTPRCRSRWNVQLFVRRKSHSRQFRWRLL